jgi:hypothetical protein
VLCCVFEEDVGPMLEMRVGRVSREVRHFPSHDRGQRR